MFILDFFDVKENFSIRIKKSTTDKPKSSIRIVAFDIAEVYCHKTSSTHLPQSGISFLRYNYAINKYSLLTRETLKQT